MYIKVKVRAGAKKETLEQISKDHFVVSVREKAERNMANRRVVAVLAKHFGAKPHQVKIISGHHSPSKILSIDIVASS